MICPHCGRSFEEGGTPPHPRTAKERITYILKSATAPLSPSEIGRLTGLKPGTTRWALRELLAGGVVSKDERGYSLPNRDTNVQSAEDVGEQTGEDDSFSLGVMLNPALLAALEERYGGE